MAFICLGKYSSSNIKAPFRSVFVGQPSPLKTPNRSVNAYLRLTKQEGRVANVSTSTWLVMNNNQKKPTLAEFGQQGALHTEEEGPQPPHLAPIRGLPGTATLVGALIPADQAKLLAVSPAVRRELSVGEVGSEARTGSARPYGWLHRSLAR